MVGTSKILTVSYGTFSCTLEGFDDPFTTMRSIAEYFRDLAADDRYFGAEPPTPDAEMLHRIAEREINRKVIASVDGNAVTLRQAETASAAAPDAADVPSGAPQAEAPLDPAPGKKKRKKDKGRARALAMGAGWRDSPAGPAEAPAHAVAAAEAPSAGGPAPAPEAGPAPLPADDFTARMLRIRAAVARATPAPGYAEDEQEPLFGFRPISSAFVDVAAPDAELVDEPPASIAPAAAVAAGATSEDQSVTDAASGDDATEEPVADEVPAASADDTGEPGEADDPALADLISRVRQSAPDDDATVADDRLPADVESTRIDIVASEVWTSEPAGPSAPAPVTVATRLVRARVIKMRKPAADIDEDGAAGLPAADGRPEDDAALAGLSAAIAAASESQDDDALPADEALAEAVDAAADLAAPDADGDDDATAQADDFDAAGPDDADALAAEFDDGGIDNIFSDDDDADDAIASGTGDAGLETPAPSRPATSTGLGISTLSDEEEADLMAELASLEEEAPAAAPGSGFPVRSAMPADEDDALGAEAEAALIAALSDDADAPALTAFDDETEEFDLDAAFDEEADRNIESAFGEDEDLAAQAPYGETGVESEDLAQDDGDAGTDAAPQEGAAAAQADVDDAARDAAGPADAPTDDADRPGRAPRGARIGGPLRATGRAGDDASVTRILAETNSQLDDSSASQRRSTIAHLKAAVAATRADREMGEKDDTASGALDQYRQDLERVVRPRRPGERSSGTTRRLAPLMLVSEQRIDLPRSESVLDKGAIRPRRITAGNLALLDDEDFDDDGDDAEDRIPGDLADGTKFEDYVRKLGATDLPDLMEAAAAYAAYVEGRPHLSRPQLMKRAISVAEGEVSREDGLRSFGTLLRTGRIQKLKRGQFTIAKGSRFRPDSASF